MTIGEGKMSYLSTGSPKERQRCPVTTYQNHCRFCGRRSEVVHGLLGKDERYHVSQMHAIATGSSTRIQKERFALFISVQDDVEFSMNQYKISVPSR